MAYCGGRHTLLLFFFDEATEPVASHGDTKMGESTSGLVPCSLYRQNSPFVMEQDTCGPRKSELAHSERERTQA